MRFTNWRKSQESQDGGGCLFLATDGDSVAIVEVDTVEQITSETPMVVTTRQKLKAFLGDPWSDVLG